MKPGFIYSMIIIIISSALALPQYTHGYPQKENEKEESGQVQKTEKKHEGIAIQDKALAGSWSCQGKKPFTMTFGIDGYYYENKTKMAPYTISRDIINIYGFQYQVLELEPNSFKWRRVGTKPVVSCTKTAE